MVEFYGQIGYLNFFQLTFKCDYGRIYVISEEGDDISKECQIVEFMEYSLAYISKWNITKDLHIQPHSHNFHEISFYNTNCDGIAYIGNKEYKFTTGDIIVNTIGTIHSEKHFSDGVLTFFCFSCDDFPLKSGIYHNMWNMKSIIEYIRKESLNQNYKYNELISLKIAELVINLERISNDMSSSQVMNLLYFKNYIEENSMLPINISDLAKNSGYSYDHFRHLFKQTFGISPKNYLTDIRCTHALDMLQNSDLKCTDIAYECGFSDSSQMSKMIKNKYGISPIELIKLRNNDSASLKADTSDITESKKKAPYFMP